MRVAGAIFSLVVLVQSGLLFSKTILVPQQFPTIKAAVAASSDGDTVEVNNGTYLEENIVVDKSIIVKSKNVYGAVIYASEKRLLPIFAVRAKARIQGFVLKNGWYGIQQRDSSDVEWEARDLIILGMRQSAISVDDVADRIGSARLRNILIDNCSNGIVTNDAREIDLRNCLIANSGTAFAAFDHIFFKVDQAIILNCRLVCYQDESMPSVNSRIDLGKAVLVLNSGDLTKIQEKKIEYLRPKFLLDTEPSNRGKTNGVDFGGAFALNILGDIYAASGDYQKALSFYRDAFAYGSMTNSKPLIWDAHVRMARAYAKTANFGRALESYRQAIEVIEEAGSDLPQRIYRLGFSEDKIRIYEEVVSFLFERHMEDPLKRYDREAFFFAEKSKTQGFLESLRKFRSDLQPGSLADLNARAISDEISKTQSLIQERDGPWEEQRKLSRELELLETSYRNLMTAARRKISDNTSDIDYAATITQGLQEALMTGDTALLEYMVGDRKSFAFLVTRENFAMVSLPEANALVSLVQNYLKYLCLNPKEAPGFRGEKGGRRLFDLLIGSFGIGLGKNIRKLVIVPDHILFYLPFETLVRNDGAASSLERRGMKVRPRFLVEDYEVSYAPSASSFVNSLRSRTEPAGKMDLLAVACSGRRWLWSIPAGIKNDFPPLVHAVEEIRAIAELFPKVKIKLVLSEDAQERKIKELPLSDFKIIHLAAHGYFDEVNWWRSALLLGKTKGSTEDGLLQPLDISRLDLNSDLVVLSACQSGNGELQKGEGILGFSMAFLAAGSASVVSSLWNVDDASTAQFMKSFYRHLLNGDTKAAALRSSKIEMMRLENRHPFYWAPFVLMGDPYSPLSLEMAR